MNKPEISSIVASRIGSSNVAAEKAVNAIFESMSKALVDGERIDIRGFGNFTVRDYKAYQGRDPRDGSIVSVGEKKLPHFKPSRAFVGKFAEGGKADRYHK